jgi:1-deoxy-D-xylulose-5-phosphate reductoisomerase
MSQPKQRLAILGSTGSIGTQTLDVVTSNESLFEVYALTAKNNATLLIEQARKFLPEVVVIANEKLYGEVSDALKELPIKVFTGTEAIAQVATMDCIDTVVTAMVGYSGLAPTIAAIKAKKKIALANKETLVVAGELITDLVQQYRATILPIDSEHGAIFQCIVGEHEHGIEKVILTASGGPFLRHSIDELKTAKAADALKHPTWNMGAKITVDSASLMNKGFEVIEAKWLFGLKPEQVDVVIHPQSIIHSMVQFHDSSIKAQMSLPDMRLPIQYALTYPNRISMKLERLDFGKCKSLTFEEPDTKRFRNLSLAYNAMRRGGNIPCVLNAANEVVVDAYLRDRIGFLDMSDIIEKVMESSNFIAKPTYEDYIACDRETRIITQELIK